MNKLSSAKKLHILIVDDEPSIAESLEYVLKTEGFEVTKRGTACDGIHFIREHDPDLIILDISLPDGNGFDLCRELRTFSSIPVLFLTARHNDVDTIVGLEIGADDYVSKPFSPREVAARVKAILRRALPPDHQKQSLSATRSPTARNTSGLTIDETRKIISYHGMRLDLSRMEYRLLKVLMEQPGRVFSRVELMEKAWDDPGASFDRTVDAHIKTLRNKLRTHSDEELIITHRGMGYSFIERS